MNKEIKPRIRRASQGDINGMSVLLNQLFKIENSYHTHPQKFEKGLSLLLANWDYAIVLVAEYDFKVVGMFTAQILISTVEGDKVALLEDLIIDEQYRNKGIGKRLLEEMEKIITNKGLKRMQLLADIRNYPAKNFYNKNNWHETPMKCWRKFPGIP